MTTIKLPDPAPDATPAPATPIDILAAALATMIDRDLITDPYDMINSIADHLIRENDQADLRMIFDICPIHKTDIDACADDDLDECRDIRA